MSDLTVELLRLSLNAHQTVQKSHVENIANANNKVYQKQHVNFEKMLLDLQGIPAHERLERVNNLLNEWSQTSIQYSNTVDTKINLDDEVARATLAAGAYQKSVELLNRKLGLMQMAVKGGKGR